MGAGSSSMACFYKRPDIEVRWFGPDSPESMEIQNAPDGFGLARNKSYRAGATLHPSMNRKGNLDGELAGTIVFYSRADWKTNYARKRREPCFDVKIGTKIFAKAFFSVPMGMMPIGENNLPYRKQNSKASGGATYSGFGPVLLAPLVRAIALFVDVDGVAQKKEILCEASAQADDNMRYPPDDSEECADEPVQIISSAIRGSFVTFCPARVQDTFFFLHIPILTTHNDCLSVETGLYALTVAHAFHRLFSSLSPGKHRIRLAVQIYYDSAEFRYFILDRNMNARGQWKTGVQNELLRSPHPDPNTLQSPDTLTAEGAFTMNISFNLTKMLDGILDRKPPREKYRGDDIEDVRKQAAVVAMGKFNTKFNVQGMPNLTVLTSDAMQISDKDKDGNKFTYKVVEFVACWVNPDDSSPQAFGRMFEGAMAKGQISPNDFTNTWSWYSRRRNGEIVEPVPIEVKNKHILVKVTNSLQKRLISMSKGVIKNGQKS